MNQQMNEMNGNEQSCHGAGFHGTAAAQRAWVANPCPRPPMKLNLTEEQKPLWKRESGA